MATVRLCLAIGAGLALGLGTGLATEALALLAALALAGAIITHKQGHGTTAVSLLLLALFTLGVWRGQAATPQGARVSAYVDTGPRRVTCVVASDPERRGLELRFVCRLAAVDGVTASGGVMITAPATAMPRLGETVAFTAPLQMPPESEEFDYRGYLGRRGVAAVARAEALEMVGQAPPSPAGALLDLRRRAISGLHRAVPDPEAAFIGGILVGSAEGMPASVRDDLKRSGLMHVLVVSGFNVSLVVAAVVGLLRRVAGWRAILLTVAALGAGYAAMTGGDPPVVRAVIMALFALGGRVAGRPSSGLIGLAVSAMAMAVHRPTLLLEPSYQLSVAATAGMMLSPRLPAGWSARHRYLALPAGVFLSTLGAQAAALPLLAAHTGSVPLLGLAANALVVPAQPPLMLSAVPGALATALPFAVAGPACYPAWLLSRYTLEVARITARLPLASVETGHWGMLVVAAYYALALVAVNARRLRRAWPAAVAAVGSGVGRLRRPSPVAGLAVVTVAVWSVALQLPDGRLHVAFLDVGQGDAVLITTPGGRRVLVDGGRDPDVLMTHLGRALPFWQRRIDVLVLTHPDMDHLGGLLGLPSRYRVGHLVPPDGQVPAAWREQWAAVEASAAATVAARAGTRIAFSDGVVLEVLYPFESGCAFDGGDNDCSTVMSLNYGQATVLLTGDIERPAEMHLLERAPPGRAWLLKVAHHGSGRCTGDEFLDQVAPGLAVVSVGQNRYDHPGPEVLARLADRGVPVLRTDQRGTIEFVTDGQRYTINTAW